MRNRPTGTVTFLFTDIEGSTKLAREHSEAWETARAQHDSIMREAIEANDGHVFQIIGDSFCVAFHKAGEALKAAIKAQHDLQNESWGDVLIRVRMGIHTGEAEVHEQEYHGYLTLSLVQRVMAAGHGGQILLSNVTENLLHDSLPKDVSLRDMGEHKLKGVSQPVQLFQVIVLGLQSDFPVLETQNAHPNNLPVQLTDFIGREKELADIAEALAQNRLVTLIGAGGTGKTRLAIEAGAVQLSKDHFTNGVFFISLAPLESTESIVPTIASSLGFSFYGGGKPRQQLLDYLREKSLLLIMDNFEHLLSGVDLVTEILNTAPHIKILATSRARLNVQGEQLFHLTGMDFPNWESPQDAIEYSAVKLFTQTAHRVRSDFELTTDNIKYIVRLCRLVDGIPLGILLAASWMEMLAPEEIAGEIEKSLDFLEARQRDLPDRQHSMRAVFDYSWKLLTENEQNVFMKSSVFRGGFTREAAEQVTGASLRDLMGLLDKSFLQRDSNGRYQIHELLRQYAYEKLVEVGEEKDTRNHHRDWFLDLAEQAMPNLHRGTQLEWLDCLDEELDNLRATLDWALEKGEAELALKFASNMAEYWEIRGYYSEAKGWYERSLALVDGAEQLRCSKWYARVLLYLGDILIGDNAVSQRDKSYQTLRDALEILKMLNDKPFVARALLSISDVCYSQDKLDEAITIAEEAVTTARTSDDKYFLALSLYYLAYDLSDTEYLRTRALFEESLQIAQELGDRGLMSRCSCHFGYTEVLFGNVEYGYNLIKQALSTSKEIRDWLSTSLAYYYLGSLAFEQGEYEEAKVHYQQYLTLVNDMNMKSLVAHAINRLGRIALYQKNIQEATNFYQESLKISTVIQDDDLTPRIQIDIGFMLLCENKDVEAGVLFQRYLPSLIDKPPSARWAVLALNGLGEIARRQCNLKESLRQCHDAIKLIPEWEPAFTLDYSLDGLARTLSDIGEYERAIRLLGAADSMRKKWGGVVHPVFREEYDRCINLLREKLGSTKFKSLWAEGASLSIDEAIALAV